MKTFLFTFVLTPLFVFGQTEFEKRYGKGILEVNTASEFSTFNFYKTPDDTTPVIRIEFKQYYDSSKHCRDYLYEKTIGADSIFVPELLHRCESCVPFQLNIAWVQEKGDFYQVIMNTSYKRKLVWIKKSGLLKKLSWQEFFTGMCSVEVFEAPPPKAWREPSKKSVIVFDPRVYMHSNTQLDYTMKCLAVKGYWMQVEIRFSDASKKPVKGWFLWHNDSDSFISYHVLCC
ncbi:MAG TPA: hypothetical protein VD905_09320 [Flavobacteriales bacterium]|nr:hypothetical protein [Flavobacteriales bacterium]